MVMTEGPKANGYQESSNGATSRTVCSGTMTEAPECQTLGWRKSCRCETEETLPAVVLDPFSGAGTTVLAARRLDRRAIGIELSADFAALSRRRVGADNPLFNALETAP